STLVIGPDPAIRKAADLLSELGQDFGNLLLAVDDLGEEADAVDLAFLVPGGFDQDTRLVLRRDGEAVHRLREAFAVKLAEFLFGHVFDGVDRHVALEPVVVGLVVEALLKARAEFRYRRDWRIDRQADMALHAVGRFPGKLNGLLAEQRGIAD